MAGRFTIMGVSKKAFFTGQGRSLMTVSGGGCRRGRTVYQNGQNRFQQLENIVGRSVMPAVDLGRLVMIFQSFAFHSDRFYRGLTDTVCLKVCHKS